MRKAILMTLLAALLLPACSSGGSKKGGNTIPPAPPYKDPLAALYEEQKQPAVPPPKVGEGEEFTKEEKEYMSYSFRRFMREEADWPSRRERWLQIGEAATNVLVENLFVYMLAAQNASRPDDARRAQAELVDLGPPTFPYLLTTLSLETFVDRTGEKQRVDEMTRRTAAETLALIGEPAIDPLLENLPRMPEASRRVACREMANLIDPRVTKALLGLLDDPAYVVAAESAKSLRTHPGSEVTMALVGVYGDTERDVAVRTQAGKSLYSRRDPAAVKALVDLLERALATDDLGLLRSTGNLLRRTTGQRIADDPKAWRAWLAKEG